MIRPERYYDWQQAALRSPGQRWHVPHFLPAEALTLIAGRPKYGKKSWIAYALAFATATGQRIGPFAPTGPAGVLYIDLEGNAKEAAKRPLLMSAGNLQVPDLRDTNMWEAHGQPLYLHNPNHLRELIEIVKRLGISVVFIDTLFKTMAGMDENSVRDMSTVLAAVDCLKRVGCAVVLVHHLRKAYTHTPGQPMDATAALRGSSALEGGFDHIIAATNARVDGEAQDFWLIGGKFYDFRAFTVAWKFVPDVSVNLTYSGPHEVPVPDERPSRESGPFGSRL